MGAKTYNRRRIISITAVCIMTALICAAFIFFIGCGDDSGNNKENYSVTYSSGVGGSITGKTSQSVEYGGTTWEVIATPDNGYEFVKWSDGVETAKRTDSNVTKNISVMAIFARKVYVLEYTAGENGSLVGETRQSVEHLGQGETVTAVPNAGYIFVKWSDGVETAERQDKEVVNNISITALFERLRVDIRYFASEGGYIDGESVQEINRGQNGSAVTAQPNEGYDFIEWSDGVSEATRAESDVQTDVEITAIFKKKVFKVMYSYTHPIYGTVEGERVQEVEYGENSSTVKAVPIEGYEFEEWSDGCTDAERTDYNITDDIYVIARFRQIYFRVTFLASEDGMTGVIHGTSSWYVPYGGQSATVEACPNDGYVFVCWSDGLETPIRTEYNVKSDIELIAYFGVSATYVVNGNVGGTIKGESYQKAKMGEDFEAVEAVPNVGYAFGGWDDLLITNIRQDKSAERQIEHIAYFEPISRTFKYDYGIASGAPLINNVTINREDIKIDGYITPTMQGYKFAGWYADKEYSLKAINENGRYMLGYYGFNLETDTLYARWKKNDEEETAYKILLVYINEVQATLKPAKKNGDGIARNVHHIMTTMDREYCALSQSLTLKYLSEWLNGVTTVEVDAYYTTQSVDEQYTCQYIHYIEGLSSQYSMKTSDLPELSSLYQSYSSILTVFGLGEHYKELANYNIIGSASTKYGDVYLASFYFLSGLSIPDSLLCIKENIKWTEMFIDTFLHEFIHTCEFVYLDGEIVEFHKALSYQALCDRNYDNFDAMRKYLLCELDYYGQKCGIPSKFWTDKADKMLSLNWTEALFFDTELNN